MKDYVNSQFNYLKTYLDNPYYVIHSTEVINFTRYIKSAIKSVANVKILPHSGFKNKYTAIPNLTVP